MKNYHVMGQPTSYMNHLSSAMFEAESEDDWKDKARKLQARRWRKIMRTE